MVELTKQKGAKVPELLRCACNPDSSQIARNKKETETSSMYFAWSLGIFADEIQEELSGSAENTILINIWTVEVISSPIKYNK
jgi:hypothetical protein